MSRIRGLPMPRKGALQSLQRGSLGSSLNTARPRRSAGASPSSILRQRSSIPGVSGIAASLCQDAGGDELAPSLRLFSAARKPDRRGRRRAPLTRLGGTRDLQGMADGSPAFLGVERSLCGRRWRQRAGDDRAGLALAQQLGLPEILGRLLAARGVGAEAADRFLTPTLRDSLPDPSHLKDMDKAVARLARAVTAGETIAVFGDYDVDGATSAALLQRFLEAVGARVRVYIPDRQREGY